MKHWVGFCVAAWIISGCAAGSAISHDDSPGATNRDAGPVLCTDATTPPCEPPRD